METECSDIRRELESWYDRDSGRYLLGSTREALADLLDTSFGYHILQLGITCGQPLYESSPINHRIYISGQTGGSVTLLANGDELPLESDSIDAVIAHHSLEFVRNPHEVLREIQRVLTPQGQLLIIGFNPYSLHGLGSWVRGLLRKSSLWHSHQPVSENRLSDWLRLLGCEVQSRTRLYALPPVGRGRLRDWLTRSDAWCSRYNLPLGGLYITHAIKKVSALHRPLPSRLRRARLIGLATPAAAPRTGTAAREGDAPT
jgi:SAM-dependent methyltransferase